MYFKFLCIVLFKSCVTIPVMNRKKELALYGGPPARSTANPPMFPGGLHIDEKEEAAVLEVLRSKRLFRYYGPFESESKALLLEERFAAAAETDYCLVLNSCTNGLLTALIAAGVQPGDEVIIPAYTFVASAAAVVAANAVPVLAEIDDSFTIDPSGIEKNITKKTRAIMPVHMRGEACSIEDVLEIADRYDLRVIEDAAQANGGTYKGKALGSYGDAGCFSFQYHKIITGGEGGAITTNDKELIERAKSIHDTGANWRNAAEKKDRGSYPRFPGYNFRMTELTAAVILVQLEKRNMLLENMRAAAARIRSAVHDFPAIQLRRLHDPEGGTGICCMFTAPDTATAVLTAEALQAEGIDASVMGREGVPDWHIYKYWDHILKKRGNNDSGYPFSLTDREYSEDMCPRTLDLLSRVVHLNVSPDYSSDDVSEICEGISKVLSVIVP